MEYCSIETLKKFPLPKHFKTGNQQAITQFSYFFSILLYNSFLHYFHSDAPVIPVHRYIRVHLFIFCKGTHQSLKIRQTKSWDNVNTKQLIPAVCAFILLHFSVLLSYNSNLLLLSQSLQKKFQRRLLCCANYQSICGEIYYT